MLPLHTQEQSIQLLILPRVNVPVHDHEVECGEVQLEALLHGRRDRRLSAGDGQHIGGCCMNTTSSVRLQHIMHNMVTTSEVLATHSGKISFATSRDPTCEGRLGGVVADIASAFPIRRSRAH